MMPTTRWAAALATAAVFQAALLMFWAEPLAAKMVLPLLGGSPMVWNTAMVFFQVSLLAGYAGAHLMGRTVLPVLLLLAAGAALLPIAAPAFYPPPPAGRWPVPWLAGYLALAVGAPFVALATVTPLVQRWLAQRAGADRDVYRLYGASNLGSLMALLAFPFILEPLFDMAQQTRLWAVGYALLLACMAALAFALGGAPAAVPATAKAEIVPAPAPGWRERLFWLLLAMVPASLLFGVTTHITTDIASAPFLWVIPLALYLLSFVAAFSGFGERAQPVVVMVQVVLLIPVVLALPLVIGRGWPLFLLHLAAFFVTAWVCHGELYRRRPAPARLTEFYFWLALGGVAGGLFNTLLAPVLFPGVFEYPLAIVAAAWLRPRQNAAPTPPGWADFLLPLGAGFLYLATIVLRGLDRDGPIIVAIAVASGGTLLAVYACRRDPARFALALGAILAVGVAATDKQGMVDRERTFFGVHGVTDQDGTRILFHGTTVHGVQKNDPGARRVPLGYYHPDGPLGQFFAARGDDAPPLRAALVGLGAGASACYRRAQDAWTFYEIDPAVEKLARRWFAYLAECAPQASVVIGDGRLSLAMEADGGFGLILLDAFSSDSVPVHLLTREALALYVAKLAPGGVLLLHLSNRHLDLAPVAARLAAAAGLAGRVQFYNPDVSADGPSARERSASIWVALARDEAALGTLAADSRWDRLRATPDARPWTDGFSDLARAIRW